MTEPVVVGVDSSTQSCKVVVRRLSDGVVVREVSAPHPDGTEVDPAAWESAMGVALDAADGLGDDVVAIGIAGQQHGMVSLDAQGEIVRPALLWNDTRSAQAAADLVGELGAEVWAQAVGSVPLASFTVAKLRWLAEHEPEVAARVAALCLPHDWLTWRLRGAPGIDALVTDRGDATGTGYWSPADSSYRPDLLVRAFGRDVIVPRVADPWEVVGEVQPGLVVSAGTGDNMAAALGLDAQPGDAIVSIGTSGVVAVTSDSPTADPSGAVAGFADATGRYLPLVCTLNGAPVLARMAALLGCDLDRFAVIALEAEPGAGGVVLVPYLDGERTPNLPDAHGELVGMTSANVTPANVARATVEGVLCGLADGLDVLRAQGADVDRVILVGGGSRSAAVQRIAPTVFDVDVLVAEPAEYVALGAARQAATAFAGGTPPAWSPPESSALGGSYVSAVRDHYREAAAHAAAR